MKILKHGKANRVITCNCGCEFEFDISDIQFRQNGASPFYSAPYWDYSYIRCPECAEYISILVNFDINKIQAKRIYENPLTNSFNSSIIKE